MRGENVLERESGEAECEEERDLTTNQHDGRQDSGGWTPPLQPLIETEQRVSWTGGHLVNSQYEHQS